MIDKNKIKEFKSSLKNMKNLEELDDLYDDYVKTCKDSSDKFLKAKEKGLSSSILLDLQNKSDDLNEICRVLQEHCKDQYEKQQGIGALTRKERRLTGKKFVYVEMPDGKFRWILEGSNEIQKDKDHPVFSKTCDPRTYEKEFRDKVYKLNSEEINFLREYNEQLIVNAMMELTGTMQFQDQLPVIRSEYEKKFDEIGIKGIWNVTGQEKVESLVKFAQKKEEVKRVAEERLKEKSTDIEDSDIDDDGVSDTCPNWMKIKLKQWRDDETNNEGVFICIEHERVYKYLEELRITKMLGEKDYEDYGKKVDVEEIKKGNRRFLPKEKIKLGDEIARLLKICEEYRGVDRDVVAAQPRLEDIETRVKCECGRGNIASISYKPESRICKDCIENKVEKNNKFNFWCCSGGHWVEARYANVNKQNQLVCKEHYDE